VAAGTVLCSGLLARPAEPGRLADRAYYLDAAWRTVVPGDAGSVTIIEWPDFGVIDPDTLRQIADGVVAGLVDGPVDIGCLGGHGRTGTLLATVIGRVESAPADDAIRIARERYCTHAVETPVQAALVAAALTLRVAATP
jgi:hypothetical protein